MNKWIEVYMEEQNLKPNELFKLQSETYLDEYCFDESGILRRNKNNHLEMASAEILGRLMRGVVIKKVKPKGRYIPKKGECYWYIDLRRDIARDQYFSKISESLFKHTLVFRTKEEAEDYRWFLDKVDEYKKFFLEGDINHYFYYTLKNKRIGISWNDDFMHNNVYFGTRENIEEFRNVVGDELIKKYMFDVWE